jgi:hypothetical protein
MQHRCELQWSEAGIRPRKNQQLPLIQHISDIANMAL